jgi:hypothetical protein
LGRLVLEDGRLTFYRNRGSMLDFIQEATGAFDKVAYAAAEVPFEHHGQPGHRLIIENFCNAVLKGETLIAPAAEGLHSVMLGNAIMLSSFLGRTVEMPIDEDLYQKKLTDLIEQSRYQKAGRDVADVDMGQSFGS